MKRIALIALLLLLATVAYGQNRMSGVRYAAAPAAGGGTDFTQDANCQGAWLIFTDGTETSAETNQCSSGDQDALVQQGGTFVTASPPSGSASGQDAVDFSAVTNTDMIIDDPSGQADEFEAQDFSMGCWVLNNDGGLFGVIISKNDTPNYETSISTTEAYRGEVSGTIEDSAASVNVVDAWEHFVMRYEGTAGNEIEIFQNAADICNGGCATDLEGVGATTDDFVIGANQAGSNVWTGDLMECFYMDRILTNEEICQICRCGFDDSATDRDAACGSCSMGSGSCTN